MLCVGRSYFSGTDIQCILNDTDEASLIGEIEKGENYEVKLKLKKKGKKVLEKNGKKYDRIVDHIGQFFAVVIAPGDINLIYDDNSERRRYLDQILGQTDPIYLKNIIVYKKLIEQRNRHLKLESHDPVLISVLDEQIAPVCREIYDARKTFLKDFIGRVRKYYALLSRDKEHVDIHYISQLEDRPYLDWVGVLADKDRILGRSNAGVHKDELNFTIDGYPLKKYGSQGQIKSYLIALKLAEYEHYKIEMGVQPFLLLDDIFEKIDKPRATALTDIIKSGNFGQIFVTDTQQNRLEQFCGSISEDYQLIAL